MGNILIFYHLEGISNTALLVVPRVPFKIILNCKIMFRVSSRDISTDLDILTILNVYRFHCIHY